MNIEGLELILGLFVVDRVPFAVEHITDLHLVLSCIMRLDIDRIFLLGFYYNDRRYVGFRRNIAFSRYRDVD